MQAAVYTLDPVGNRTEQSAANTTALTSAYDAAGLHYNLNDWLGSKRVQVAASGAIDETCWSQPFGDNLNCQGPVADDDNLHFTGKERDTESGNDYFEARYYASTMGRFMSPDWSAKEEPVPYAKLDNPQTLNLYAYLMNNPLAGVDADGHESGQIPEWELKILLRVFIWGYPKVKQMDKALQPTLTAIHDTALDAMNPTKNCPNCQIGIMPFGMTGGLSTLGAASRLSLAELSTGERLAAQTGLHLSESAHIGAEFIDSAGKTYDAMGQPAAYAHWNQGEFFNSIDSHLNKSVDYVAIDLKGASKDQVGAIQTYVSGLAKEAQARIKYVQ